MKNKKQKISTQSVAGKPAPDVDPAFPIAGFGASAGGVEAFTSFLAAIAPDTGIGFVLVQHLDAKHSSVLVEILRRATKMPVLWATQNMPVERNQVHVIPPNADLEIEQGKLQLKVRSAAQVPHLPIDHFLESLAVDRGSMSIGVILSGTASDGTLGLKAIKAEGGITFAQRESSAKYGGMPSSAISAGVVDYILPPDGIARELARIGRHPYLHLREPALSVLPQESDNDLAKLFSMLRTATGVDFTHYKHTTIRRRILRRMVVQKIDRLPDYVAFVHKNPAELKALYRDILINVTGFFRDPGMYAALKRSVFPKLLRHRDAADPVRIWVPGCSTGEEAYSIAIALSEFMRAKSVNFPIQIFATDIGETAIERARSAIYPENIAAEIAPDILRRYFQSVNGHFQVIRTLREMCVFARQNVIQDAPFSKVDLISCRNLMIYLGTALQRRIVTVFHYALKPAGFLVLGTSETIGTLSELFTLVDKKNKVYLKKPGAGRQMIALDVAAPMLPPAPAGTVPHEPHRQDLGREADRILLNRFTPPGVIVNEALKVLQFRGRTGRFLEPESGEPSLNLLRMAREGLLPALRSALLQARKKGSPVRVKDVRVRHNGDSVNVTLEVVPFGGEGGKQRCYLVLFEEQTAAPPSQKTRRASPSGTAELQHLKQELASTKDYLQSIIEEQEANNEELKSANEEIQSSNEELQSINEEMETAKEELQSTNEELTTVNEELHTRNLELSRANNDLNNLISSTQIPLVMVDNDARLRRFTPPAEKLLNLIATDLGRPLLEIQPNLILPDLKEILQDVIDNLRVVEREVRDHRGRSYSMWVRPYRTEEKKIDGAVMAFVDVTALKESMEQSRDLREYVQAMTDTVREPLLVLDSELRVMSANAPFFESFHLSPESTRGAHFFEIAGGAWNIPPLRKVLVHRGGADGFTQGIELEHDFGPAGRKALSINLRHVPGAGAPRIILLAIEDISERRRAEETLRDTMARYSALAREAPVGILQAQTKGECVFANTHAARLAGVSPEQALARGWMKYIHPDDLRLLDAKLDQASAGEDGFSLELRFVYPGGAIAWAHMILIPLREVARKSTEYLIALTDITPRKDLEDRLAQAQKMEAIGRLAGGVAHDFNNMLTAMTSYGGQLLEVIPPEHPARPAALQINKLAEHSALVTRQLLAFSRKQVMRPRHADINHVLREMHDLLARMLGENIEMHLFLQPGSGTVTVMADVAQIQQLILNLAINARDAMTQGGRLTIRTEKITLSQAPANRDGLAPGDYVLLSVSDTGIGMDPETQQRMFEPFFTTKPPGEGTGLGLSTAYGIIKQSGGTVRVESAPHKGSTFHVYLPRAEGEEEEPPILHPPPAMPGGTETILVVEDAAVVRSLICELLQQRGYTVIEAGDARHAITQAEAHKVNLLLTDVILPGMNGYDLAKKLRRRRKDLKVIYMSGYTGESLQAVEKEANFLEKPFKPNVLAELVRKVLDN